MNSNIEPNGHRRPSEGDRLGGTLAEGRLARRSAPMEQARMAGAATPTPPAMRVEPGRTSSTPAASNRNAGKDPEATPGVVKGLETLHLEHRVWLNSLRFYREELFIFQRHLEQFVRTAAVPETMAHVEQYQNRFLRQTEVIDELAHDIKEHDRALAGGLNDTGSSVIYRPYGVHNELREKMEMFERLYMELKHDFRKWLAYNR
jgi:hypothetical protein